ncbi:MAG: hypothetical protein HYZ54_05170 [Ignavibacteriae bacterium]|nr:hypothetical protein [Ignavibacteriota bacterium]
MSGVSYIVNEKGERTVPPINEDIYDMILAKERENESLETINNIIFLAYRKATSMSQAKQSDVDELMKEIKKDWWRNNRNRFIK